MAITRSKKTNTAIISKMEKNVSILSVIGYQRTSPFENIQQVLFARRRDNTGAGQTILYLRRINDYLQKE
jgi:hypothetical protein